MESEPSHPATPQPTPSPPQPSSHRRKRRRWIFGAIALLILSAIAYVLVTNYRGRAALRKALDAMRASGMETSIAGVECMRRAKFFGQRQPVRADIRRKQRGYPAAHQARQNQQAHETTAHHQDVIAKLGWGRAENRADALERLADGLRGGEAGLTSWRKLASTTGAS
jgi:hypothetical protein